MIRLLQGREKEAWDAYQEAFDLDPRQKQLEDHIGDLEKTLEKHPDRADLLNEALRRLHERSNQ